MNIVIFTGGYAPKAELTVDFFKTHKPDFVISADSGLETFETYSEFFNSLPEKLFLSEPNLILGDWDSLSQKSILKKYPSQIIENFNVDKDYTDTELALERAHEKLGTISKNNKTDSDMIILVGAGGGSRIDHLLAVFDLFSTDLKPDVWLSGEQFLYFLPKESSVKIFDLKNDDIVSVLRLSNSRAGGKVCSNGLEWEGGLFRSEGVPSLSNRISKEYFLKNLPVSIKTLESDFVLVLPYSARLEWESF